MSDHLAAIYVIKIIAPPKHGRDDCGEQSAPFLCVGVSETVLSEIMKCGLSSVGLMTQTNPLSELNKEGTSISRSIE